MKNKIAARARGRGSRDMAVVCIEHWKAFHYITSSNAEIGAQWIILPFTSVEHSKGYLSSFNFSFYILLLMFLWMFSIGLIVIFFTKYFKYFAFYFCKQLTVSRIPLLSNQQLVFFSTSIKWTEHRRYLGLINWNTLQMFSNFSD